VPNEILYQAFDHLPVKDLKNVAVVCERLSEVAIRYLQVNYVWDIKGSQNVETPGFSNVRQTLVSGVEIRWAARAGG
jgi:hypothetical protein